MQIYKQEESEEEDVVLVGVGLPEKAGMQQGELPRDLNSEEETSEHLKWTHLEEVSAVTRANEVVGQKPKVRGY